MSITDVLSMLFITAGAMFFLAGSIGLLRFPDTFSRLHALTKADNLGLGLTAAGLAFQTDSIAIIAKLGMIWLLVIISSATVCCLIAGAVLRHTRIQRSGDPAP